jgi:hypothetical protein
VIRALRAAASSIAVAVVVIAGADPHVGDWQGMSDQDTLTVGAHLVAGGDSWPGTDSTALPAFELMRKGLCTHGGNFPFEAPTCLSPDTILQLTCTDGTQATLPLWRRDRLTGGTTWSPWRMIDYYRCPEDKAIADLTAREFQTLTITPAGISIEPPNGWTLAGLDTVVYAEHATRTLSATILDQGVTIRAIAQSYAWDFGDDTTPITTTDPGSPYPHASISHVYRAAATRTIRLTTTWRGEYLVDGHTTWLPVDGTATTITTSTPLHVHTAAPRLVDGTAPH